MAQVCKQLFWVHPEKKRGGKKKKKKETKKTTTNKNSQTKTMVVKLVLGMVMKKLTVQRAVAADWHIQTHTQRCANGRNAAQDTENTEHRQD